MSVRTWPQEVLRSGDLVVVAQGTGEPTPLLKDLIAAAGDLPPVEVFVGLSRTGVLAAPGADRLNLVSFGAMGTLSQLASKGRVSIVPAHFSDLPRQLMTRSPKQIVVVLQTAPVGLDGRYSLGVSVDYTYELISGARAVVAEVNDQMPRTTAPTVALDAVSLALPTSRPLPVLREGAVSGVHRQIATYVAQLVPDGATIQLGVGSLPSVVGLAISGRRNLRVRSTLVGEWLLHLASAGALSEEPGSVIISEAAGSAALYEYVRSIVVQVCPVAEVVSGGPAVGPFVAMNAALEVDLTGQVNAEALDSGYLGGIGGQPDFMRAAQRSTDGRSVIMLPSTALGGTCSRIVRALTQGIVTTPRSSVDFIVTEHGIADLRGRSLAERTDALLAVAAPQHRAALARS